MGGPSVPDLAARAAAKASAPRPVDAPGAREPVTMTIAGAAGGPWVIIDAATGASMALGIGDSERQAMDALTRLAAAAVKHLPKDVVQDCLVAAAKERERITGT